jgi:hypothetical protein
MNDMADYYFCKVTAHNALGSSAAIPSNVIGPIGAAAAGSTWNPSDKTAYQLLDATNLIATNDGTDPAAYYNHQGVRNTTSRTTGKYWFEITVTAGIDPNNYMSIGICTATASLSAAGPPGNATSDGINLQLRAQQWAAQASAVGGAMFPGSPVETVNGSVWSVACDLDAHKVYLAKNGTWTDSAAGGSGAPGVGPGMDYGAGLGALFIYCGSSQQAGAPPAAVPIVLTLNTGGSAFAMTPAAGYSAWG